MRAKLEKEIASYLLTKDSSTSRSEIDNMAKHIMNMVFKELHQQVTIFVKSIEEDIITERAIQNMERSIKDA